MPSMSRSQLLQHPTQTLVAGFAAWKSLLLLLAACSPGPGYDTSTSLALAGPGPLPPALSLLITKLTRWDAIYFAQIANRGYFFEQEWAFGWGFTRLIAVFTAVVQKAGVPHYDGLESLVAISIAHTAHLLAVLVLFRLTRALFPRQSSGFALTASLLHIISPAGLFLSAPFAESSCALLTFLGCLLFTKSLSQERPAFGRDLLVLASGVTFGVATTFRSNAILNGLLLLEEALRTLFSLGHGINLAKTRRLIATGLGGLCVAVGFITPQYIAYSEYCTHPSIDRREWCGRTPPSIYPFVQDHYWNVGLFRYWTISNVPLFLLAAPMLFLMTISAAWVLGYKQADAPERLEVRKKSPTEPRSTAKQDHSFILRNLAIAQALLTLLTFTTAHVQIITRISSASPVWIWFLATLLRERSSPLAYTAVRVMVMYGIVQGGLFAAFLPPA